MLTSGVVVGKGATLTIEPGATIHLAAWAFTRGIKFKFPAGTEIEAGGFVVVCRNVDRLKEFFSANAVGTFESKLSAKGGNASSCRTRAGGSWTR